MLICRMKDCRLGRRQMLKKLTQCLPILLVQCFDMYPVGLEQAKKYEPFFKVLQARMVVKSSGQAGEDF